MMDRFAKYCGIPLATLGLAVGVAGCKPSVEQAEVRPATAMGPQAEEPPRLFPELREPQPMHAPMTLEASPRTVASMPRRSGLSLPPSDRGALGNSDELAAPIPQDTLLDPSAGGGLQAPPSDRNLSDMATDEEAPLPEFLPFETPAGLEEFAEQAPTPDDNLGDVVEADVAADASLPIEDLASTETESAPSAESPAEAAQTDIAQTEIVDTEPTAPLASNGNLAINKIKSINAADRQVARFEMPGNGEPTTVESTNRGSIAAAVPTVPAQSAVPADTTTTPVPQQSWAAKAPAPAAESVAVTTVPAASTPTATTPVPSSPAPAAVAELKPPTAATPVESLAVTTPPANEPAASVAPIVSPLEAQASTTPNASARPIAQPVVEVVPPVRAAAPRVPSSTATAAAPPSAMLPSQENSSNRAPLPASAMPTPPQQLASSPTPLAAEPAAATRSTPPQVASTTTPNVVPGQPAAMPAPGLPKHPLPLHPASAPANELASQTPLEPRVTAPAPTPTGNALAPATPIASNSIAQNQTPYQTPSSLATTNEPAASPVVAAPPVLRQESPPPQALASAAPPLRPEPSPTLPAEQNFTPRDRALSTNKTPAMRGRSSELVAVARLADEHTRRAFDLANRNAMYSARGELIEALQMVAHAIDAEEQTTEHSQALADGLNAIKESDDFVSQGGRLQDNLDVVRIASPHTTPVLKGLKSGSVSRFAAMQQYYTYAQRRLAFAVAQEPSGSLALYGLGKLYTVLAQLPPQGIVAPEPKAIVFHQASLLVDGRNYMAANELGVLLARYGKYQQAKSALLHSLAISPQPAAWHNLTVIHQQLGEAHLAELAQAESKAATVRAKEIARAAGRTLTDHATVVWMDPSQFSRSFEGFNTPTDKNQTPAGDLRPTPSTAQNPAIPPEAVKAKKGFFRK